MQFLKAIHTLTWLTPHIVQATGTSSQRRAAYGSGGGNVDLCLRVSHNLRFNSRSASMIKLLRLAAEHDRAEFERLMGFPAELHDLARLKPPEGVCRK